MNDSSEALTLGQMLRRLREERNLTQSELAGIIGVKSGGVISNWEKGINRPDVDRLVPLCNALETTVGALLGCEEGNAAVLTDVEKSVIERFRALDGYGRRALLTMLSLEYSRCRSAISGREKKDNTVMPRRTNKDNTAVTMKVYNQLASAGRGNELADNGVEDFECLNFNASEVPDGAEFGIRIKGDSMEPDICDGDIVWVREQQSVLDGEIGIFVLNGESYCKRLLNRGGEAHLESLNTRYKPIRLRGDDDLHTVGKVLM